LEVGSAKVLVGEIVTVLLQCEVVQAQQELKLVFEDSENMKLVSIKLI
jgi:hypothetical protein